MPKGEFSEAIQACRSEAMDCFLTLRAPRNDEADDRIVASYPT
jgi:hypothetical protein